MTSSLKLFSVYFNSLLYKQIDSKLPCVCSLIDHRGRQNVVRTSVTHSATLHVLLLLGTLRSNNADVTEADRK